MGVVTRARFTWSLAAALTLLGSQAAHHVAYMAMQPRGAARDRLLAATGHGYLDHAPLAIALVVALSIASLAAAAVDAARGRAAQGPSPWAFALLPFIAFAVQEHLERAAAGVPVAGTALAGTFLLGLLLQVPFALLAFAAARWLLRAAARLGVALRDRRRLPRPLPALPAPAAPRVLTVRISPLALGVPRRGPPAAACRC